MPHGYFVSGGWGFTVHQPTGCLSSQYPLRGYRRRIKVSVHITHWFSEHRIGYLRRQIEQLNDINADVDIFVHTNVDRLDVKHKHHVITHEMGEEYCHFLTWKHRQLMEDQLPYYDVFAYLEDDLLFTNDNFSYWLRHHDILRNHNFQIGFVRYEVDGRDKYATDIAPIFGDCVPLPRMAIDGFNYWENVNNFYQGCWILDNIEMRKFTQLPQWDLKKCDFYGNFIREKPAIGPIPFYDKTMLDLNDPGCYLHHMPNNYIGHNVFCKVQVDSLK